MTQSSRFLLTGVFLIVALSALALPAQTAASDAWLRSAGEEAIAGRWIYQAGNYRDVLTYTSDGRVIPDSSPGNVASWAVEGGEVVTRWPNRFTTRLALPVVDNRLSGFIIAANGGRQPVTMTREAAYNSQDDKNRGAGDAAAARGFLHAPNGDWNRAQAGPTLEFVAWDGSKWSARIQGEGFLLAPDGDWNRAAADTVLRYLTWNGAKWAAKIQEGGFLHAPEGKWIWAQANPVIQYLNWDRAKWSAKIVASVAPAPPAPAPVPTTPLPAPSGRRFQLAPNGDWDRAHVDDELKFIAWDGTKWSAKLAAGGFLLAPNGDWSRARAEQHLNYLSWDGSKWTARVENNRFVRAQDGDWNRRGLGSLIKYLAWNKSQWTGKIREGIRGRMGK